MTIFYEKDNVQLVHGDATKLGDYIEPESVDLIVTSPPYFALRSYQDGGQHYEGQIGDEETPQEFLEALWKVSAEFWKVLKPGGSMFINLGDKYSRGTRPRSHTEQFRDKGNHADRIWEDKRTDQTEVRQKSLIGLPWRYAIGLIDDNDFGGGQWLLRSEIIWAKPNGLPESVLDRVARKHEQFFHFTKNERYFAAIDEIREPYKHKPARAQKSKLVSSGQSKNRTLQLDHDLQHNPKGKLPGSVWQIPTQPLNVPDWLGVDHYAAFPMEWPYRIIKGWSPENGTILDPFGGTGTVAAIAKQLGRKAINVDLSADYLRLAKWRIFDSGHAEKWIAKNHPEQKQERLPL